MGKRGLLVGALVGFGLATAVIKLRRGGGNEVPAWEETPAGEGTTTAYTFDDSLLDILACPACRASVRREGDRIVCTGCGRRYPIRDGIPVMLVDEAEGGPTESGTVEGAPSA